jgi:hypothetical protein
MGHPIVLPVKESLSILIPIINHREHREHRGFLTVFDGLLLFMLAEQVYLRFHKLQRVSSNLFSVLSLWKKSNPKPLNAILESFDFESVNYGTSNSITGKGITFHFNVLKPPRAQGAQSFYGRRRRPIKVYAGNANQSSISNYPWCLV